MTTNIKKDNINSSTNAVNLNSSSVTEKLTHDDKSIVLIKNDPLYEKANNSLTEPENND